MTEREQIISEGTQKILAKVMEAYSKGYKMFFEWAPHVDAVHVFVYRDGTWDANYNGDDLNWLVDKYLDNDAEGVAEQIEDALARIDNWVHDHDVPV